MRSLVVLFFLNIVPLFLQLKWFLPEKEKRGVITNWTQEEPGAGEGTELLGEGRRSNVNRNATWASLDPAPSSRGSANSQGIPDQTPNPLTHFVKLRIEKPCQAPVNDTWHQQRKTFTLLSTQPGFSRWSSFQRFYPVVMRTHLFCQIVCPDFQLREMWLP